MKKQTIKFENTINGYSIIVDGEIIGEVKKEYNGRSNVQMVYLKNKYCGQVSNREELKYFLKNEYLNK